jgi:hypothetical protein
VISRRRKNPCERKYAIVSRVEEVHDEKVSATLEKHAIPTKPVAYSSQPERTTSMGRR